MRQYLAPILEALTDAHPGRRHYPTLASFLESTRDPNWHSSFPRWFEWPNHALARQIKDRVTDMSKE